MKDIATAGYIRMSTDTQEDSPARQRMQMNEYAKANGYRIVRWYEDHGKTGTESLNRPEFQQMLADASAAVFTAVLVAESSRLSREDALDQMFYFRLFRDAGVTLVSCHRGPIRIDDLGGLITALVDSHGAHDESVKLAHRSVSGKRLRVSAGKLYHGSAVFGMDRHIFDEAGRLVKVVTCFERFRRPKTWSVKLVPSADEKLTEAVQYAFDQTEQGAKLVHILREFERRQIMNTEGAPFSSTTLRTLLENPTYAGVIRSGRRKRSKRAKFAQLDREIVVENAHQGIVSLEQFRRVQEVIECHVPTRGPAEPGRFLLAGKLLECGNCGRS